MIYNAHVPSNNHNSPSQQKSNGTFWAPCYTTGGNRQSYNSKLGHTAP
jgi:hypothetical protein